MDNPFSAALRTAIAASGHSLEHLSRRLRTLGTPASVSALSNWQTGENQPERAGSLAALGNVEVLLGLPPRSLVALLPPRRPRGRWRPPGRTTLPHDRMWEAPEAVTRVLAKLHTTPDNLHVPARISRAMRVRVDRAGHERELQSRQMLRGERDGTARMVTLLRFQSLPQPPVVVATEGCRLGRFRADIPGSLCAFELLLDRPLRHGELGLVEYTTRYPPGQSENHFDLRASPGVRDIALQVAFDPQRLPARCVGFHQPGMGMPERTILERAGTEIGTSFQFITVDPAPGIYGVRWDWPTP